MFRNRKEHQRPTRPKLDCQEFTSEENACVFTDFAVEPELIRPALLSCLISSIKRS